MSGEGPGRHKTNKDCSEVSCGLCSTKINSLGVMIGNKRILKDINLDINCGEFTAIIGPNGAGKSTLLKAIIGEVKYSGKFEFVETNSGNVRRPVIGYVPQTPKFDQGCPVSVLDLFVACISKYPVWLPIPSKIINKVEEYLDRVDSKNLINKRVGVLSGGELQRVLLALALEPVPELLLLDEPVSGIDIKGMEMFYKVVNDIRKAYDLSVVMVSHDMPLIERYADRVVLINQELILTGTPKEVFSSKEYSKIFRLADNYYENGDLKNSFKFGGDS